MGRIKDVWTAVVTSWRTYSENLFYSPEYLAYYKLTAEVHHGKIERTIDVHIGSVTTARALARELNNWADRKEKLDADG